MNDEPRQPWDALPHETQAQFHGFRSYRDLGPARSRVKAWRVYAAERDLNGDRPSSTFKMWMTDNRWVDRALAYDRHEDAIRLETRQRLAEQARHTAANHAFGVIDRLMVLAAGRRLPNAEIRETDIIRASKLLLDVAGTTTQRVELAGVSNQPLTVRNIVANADDADADELVALYQSLRAGDESGDE